MTDSDQTRTKVTLKDSSGTSDAGIPSKPLFNVSVPFDDQQNQLPLNELDANSIMPNQIYIEKVPPGYIAQLRSEISILNRKINVLKEENKKSKLNTIRSSEIAFIKSQIQYYHSEDSTLQIQDLMNRYTETMRNNSALKALCLNLEKRIVFEEQKRSTFLEEIHLLSNTYNLNESIILQPPKFNRPNDSSGHIEQLEIQRLSQRLQVLQNQLNEIQNEPNYEMNAFAFNEIVKSAQIESNLKQMGTNEFKEEIELLKQEVKNSNDKINMIINENSKKRKKMENKSHQFYQEEKQQAENFQLQVQKYKEKIIKDNDKIEALRSKLEKVQSENHLIYKEIDRINDLPKPKRYLPTNGNEEEEISNSNEIDESESENLEDMQVNQANKQLEFTLNQQILQLRNEIHDLNQQYFFMKSNINESQKQKLKIIRSLDEKYQKNLEKIERFKFENSIAPTSKDKEDINNITQMISKIHGSIEEISASLIQDNI